MIELRTLGTCISRRRGGLRHTLSLACAAALLTFFSPGSAVAQSMVMERSLHRRPVGTQWATFPSSYGLGSNARLDYNGDGFPDLMITGDWNGDGRDTIGIVSGADPSVVWQLPFESSSTMQHCLGYYNLDGIVSTEFPKEIVFARRGQNGVLRDVQVFSASDPRPQPLGIIAILIGIRDTDNDGKEEIMLIQPVENRLEIWGWK